MGSKVERGPARPLHVWGRPRASSPASSCGSRASLKRRWAASFCDGRDQHDARRALLGEPAQHLAHQLPRRGPGRARSRRRRRRGACRTHRAARCSCAARAERRRSRRRAVVRHARRRAAPPHRSRARRRSSARSRPPGSRGGGSAAGRGRGASVRAARELGGGRQVGGGHRADGEGVVTHGEGAIVAFDRSGGYGERVAPRRAMSGRRVRRGAFATLHFHGARRAFGGCATRGTPVAMEPARGVPDERRSLSLACLAIACRGCAVLEPGRAEACGGCFTQPPSGAHGRDRSPDGALDLDDADRALGSDPLQRRPRASSRGCSPCAPARRSSSRTTRSSAALDASTQPVVYAPQTFGGNYGCGLDGLQRPTRRASGSSGRGAGQVADPLAVRGRSVRDGHAASDRPRRAPHVAHGPRVRDPDGDRADHRRVRRRVVRLPRAAPPARLRRALDAAGAHRHDGRRSHAASAHGRGRASARASASRST